MGAQQSHLLYQIPPISYSESADNISVIQVEDMKIPVYYKPFLLEDKK